MVLHFVFLMTTIYGRVYIIYANILPISMSLLTDKQTLVHVRKRKWCIISKNAPWINDTVHSKIFLIYSFIAVTWSPMLLLLKMSIQFISLQAWPSFVYYCSGCWRNIFKTCLRMSSCIESMTENYVKISMVWINCYREEKLIPKVAQILTETCI